jgi:hypothetical protein
MIASLVPVLMEVPVFSFIMEMWCAQPARRAMGVSQFIQSARRAMGISQFIQPARG